MNNKSKMKVLIVEDSKQQMIMLKTAIENDEQLECIGCAENGKEAVELIQYLKPDIVITDYDMPYLTGVEVIERIENEEEVNTKFFIVTGNTNEAIIKSRDLKTHSEIYSKPINVNKLLENIKTAIGIL